MIVQPPEAHFILDLIVTDVEGRYGENKGNGSPDERSGKVV